MYRKDNRIRRSAQPGKNYRQKDREDKEKSQLEEVKQSDMKRDNIVKNNTNNDVKVECSGIFPIDTMAEVEQNDNSKIPLSIKRNVMIDKTMKLISDPINSEMNDIIKSVTGDNHRNNRDASFDNPDCFNKLEKDQMIAKTGKTKKDPFESINRFISQYNDNNNALRKRRIINKKSRGQLPPDMPDSISTTTPNFLLNTKNVSGYDIKDYETVYTNQSIVEFITAIFESCDIKYFEDTLDFGYSNGKYIDTTHYDRAKVTNEGVTTSVLVAGDILVFTMESTESHPSFNLVFYITEVMVKDGETNKVLSKLDTGLLNKPDTFTYTYENNEICQWITDVFGNVYSLKPEVKVSDIVDYLTFDDDDAKHLNPTNASKSNGLKEDYDSDNFESVFGRRRMKYDKFKDAYVSTESNPSRVVLPKEFPAVDNNGSTKDKLKEFDCYIKGYFMVLRIGYISYSENNNNIYCNTFEITEYNEIKTVLNSSEVTGIVTSWLNYDTSNSKLTMNEMNSEVADGIPPFVLSGGFFPNNIYSQTGTSEFDTPLSENIFTVSNFKIYSPSFFVGNSSLGEKENETEKDYE